ncbi:MAG TPA: MBL fold metallo-hydrolase [Bryobacteraceae bacterium]|nr:MBL fold metallo-hydrolase [Bryobacteraceae bacterium]
MYCAGCEPGARRVGRVSCPFSFIGPRRHRAAGVRWEGLPPIDVALLSHNHYDHLAMPTLRRLRDRGAAQFVLPAGVGGLLGSQRTGPVFELDWGESVSLGAIAVHSVPTLHFSGRGLFDRNRTLWCGYVIEAAHQTIYFAGDTGFGPHFAQIRERFGPPRLALLPIGASEPRWFMAPVHMARASRCTTGRSKWPMKVSIRREQRLRESLAGDAFLVLHNGESAILE